MTCECCESKEKLKKAWEENAHLKSIIVLNKDHIKSQDEVIFFLKDKSSNLERKLLGGSDVQ